MSSTAVRALIVNVAAEEVGAVPKGAAALSETLDRLSTLHGEIAWPETVSAAMAELGAATDRLARLVDDVSGAASSLNAVAAQVSPPEPATDDRSPSSLGPDGKAGSSRA